MKKETGPEKFLKVLATIILGASILTVLNSCTNEEEKESTASNIKPIGVSYSQVIEPFLKYMTFKQIGDPNDLPSYQGITPDEKARLTITGNKENIVRADLLLTSDDRPPAYRCLNMMTDFLKVTFPEWKERDSWQTSTLKKLLDSESKRAWIRVGKKSVTMELLQETDPFCVLLFVRHFIDEPQWEPIGVSRSQLTKPFLKYMTFVQEEEFEGTIPRYAGVTPDGKTHLYILGGNKENIVAAGLVLNLKSNHSLYMMTSFLKAIFPEWKERDSWQASTLKKLLDSGKSDKEVITVNNKIIEMRWIRTKADIIYLEVKFSDTRVNKKIPQTDVGSNKEVPQQTIGVSYDQVMRGLNQYMPMSRGHDTAGQQPNYTGHTSDKSAMVQIIGNKGNILNTSFLIIVPNDAPEILYQKMVFLEIFLKNVIPEWDSTDWLGYAIHNITVTGKKSEGVIRGNKSVKLSVDVIEHTDLISLQIKHKDAE